MEEKALTHHIKGIDSSHLMTIISQGGLMSALSINLRSHICMLIVCVIASVGTLRSTPVIVSGGPANDYESWISRVHDGRLMVVFTRNPDWISGDLYVTFSSDNGASWDSVLPIVEEGGDQATLSFVELPGDTLRLWYASNETGEYGIYTAYSMDGINWIRQGHIDLGWGPADQHYDPTVILEPDSSLTMSYRGPGGAYIAHCLNGGSWDTLRTIVASSGYRPRVMKHSNTTYLYVYHRNTGGSNYEVFGRTSQDRVNWTGEIQLTYNLNSHDPFANESTDGAYIVYYATYIAPAYNLYKRKSYNAIDWEVEEQVTSDATNNTQPHFFYEENSVYCVWAHAVSYPYDHDVYFEQTYYTETEERDNHEFQVYTLFECLPNPCTNVLAVSTNSSHPHAVTISIYDVQGRRTALPTTHRLSSASSAILDVSALPVGTYFLILSTPEFLKVKRIVKINK
jgi:hypothetical protein